MNLYICGNGFDCHNGFETEYKYYKNFLENNFQKDNRFFNIVERAEKYLYTSFRDPESWNDVENSLKFDYLRYFQDCSELFNKPRVNPGEPFPETNKAIFEQFRGENFSDDLSYFTGIYFYNWIKDTYNKKIKENEDYPQDIKFLINNREDIFINFNYTTTLQDIYKIPDENVLHIHGKWKDVDSKQLIIPHEQKNGTVLTEFRNGLVRVMQFGSSENNATRIKKELEKINVIQQNDRFSCEKVINDIYNICMCTYKDIESNNKKLLKFLSNKNISEVIVMGHAFDGIDKPYYTDILANLLVNCKWRFYCYAGNTIGDEEKKAERRASSFARELGLSLSDNPFPKW